MAFNQQKDVSYTYVDEKNNIKYEGSLPKSALDQYDLYMAMMAYWESKTPQTWNTLRAYIISYTKVSTVQGDIPLDIAKDLNFSQINTLITKYMEMATSFFTSPQKPKDQE